MLQAKSGLINWAAQPKRLEGRLNGNDYGMATGRLSRRIIKKGFTGSRLRYVF